VPGKEIAFMSTTLRFINHYYLPGTVYIKIFFSAIVHLRSANGNNYF